MSKDKKFNRMKPSMARVWGFWTSPAFVDKHQFPNEANRLIPNNSDLND
jgi:hypothetical protein